MRLTHNLLVHPHFEGIAKSKFLKIQSQDSDLCLTVGNSRDGHLRLRQCSRWTSMKFKMSSWGRIVSARFRGYCLVAETTVLSKGTPIVLRKSTSTQCKQTSWLLTSGGQLRYGASPFVLSFDQDSLKAQLWPLEDRRKESKWDFIKIKRK